MTLSPLQEVDKIRHIISHLRSRCRSPIFIVDEAVIELPRHPDNHMVKIGVKMFSLGHIEPIRGLEVIPGHQIVDIVNSSRSESDFCEISRPDTTIGIFSLVLRIVCWVDVIVDVSVSFVPFLVVVLFVMLMSGVYCEVLAYPS